MGQAPSGSTCRARRALRQGGPLTTEIRDGRASDAGRIAAVCNQGIEDRATLETETRSAEERQAWLSARSHRHPVLVAVDGDQAIGWASLNQFNPRHAYDHVADISVYVARERRGQGVGNTLLKALELRARAIGFHKLVLAAFGWNPAGMLLYERRGFTRVGIYHEQGCSMGAGSTSS